MPDIQEAKCFKFTVQILSPPPIGAPRGAGGKKIQKHIKNGIIFQTNFEISLNCCIHKLRFYIHNKFLQYKCFACLNFI